MPKVTVTTATAGQDEVERNAANVAKRLATKNVRVLETDSAEDLANVLESVEGFEEAVRASGGDLMMDEPPPGHAAQPDNPRFVLPARGEDEVAARYIERLAEAKDAALNRDE